MGSADLELSVRPTEAGRYTLDARLSLDEALAPAALIAGPPPAVALDASALRDAALDPRRYGRLLARALFADPRAARALAEARLQARAAGLPLRLRLRLDAADEALHGLRWESLCDPETGAFLALSEELLVSRTLDTADAAPLALGPRGAARALVAVAAPDGLADFGLDPVDAADEAALAREALGPMPATVLARPEGGPATLNAIAAALRGGCDVLYLLCHGTLHEGRPFLWLEDEAGAIARVAGEDLVMRVAQLPRRPALVVLASCYGAGAGDTGALSALGPRLAGAGVAAVVAMQGPVPAPTARAFAATFFRELWRDGAVDRAVAAGRAALVGGHDWWTPVLYQRLRDGQIWREAPDDEPDISVQVTGSIYGQVVVNTGPVTQVTPARLTSLHQLRAPLDDFVGRAAELETLRAALRPREGIAPTAAICGMGGLGKTELALRAAHELRGDYPDAQLFVSLHAAAGEAARGAAVALANLIRSFDANATLPEDLEALVDLYLGHLSGRRALVLLDDAPDSASVRPFTPPAGCALIITSRSRIWLKGQGRTIGLGLLTRDESRALLLNDAPHLAGHPALEALLERCGDLPIALRVAAAALADEILTPERYLARLDDEARRLKAMQYEDVDVYALLGASDDLLAAADPGLARRWRMLGVCPAPFEAAVAAAIWGEGDQDAIEAGLEALVRRSLLGFDPEVRQYRVHDLLRDVAAARRPPEDDATAHRRHAAHYLAVYHEAQRLYQAGHDDLLRGLRLYDAGEEHIRAAAAWALAAATPEADALLLGAVESSAVMELRLTPRERIAWLAGVLAAARRQGDRVEEANLLIWLGDAHHALGQWDEARASMEQALELARTITNQGRALRALIGIGRVLIARGMFQEAIPVYEEAIAIARAIRDQPGECRALINLAVSHRELQQVDSAETYYVQALELTDKIQDRGLKCLTLQNLGDLETARGNYEIAHQYLGQSLTIAREIGDRTGESNASWSQGELLVKQGRYAEAAAVMQFTVDYERETGSPLAEEDAATLQEIRRKANVNL